MTRHITKIAVSKALQSLCTYKVSALGLNKKGEIIYKSTNKHRFDRLGGSVHAEMDVMLRAGPGLAMIVLCRVGRSGDILPIHSCPACQRKADELGVKIVPVV
jgi:hypothetical protein